MSIPELSANVARVIASLVEKSISTPDYYPMTVNGLRAACNQKSQRHPHLQLSEGDVGQALRDLEAMGWVCLLYTSPSPRDKRQSRMPSSA